MEAPINMILSCPSCSFPHLDEATAEWPNPPHRSHLCLRCGWVWRPADVPTNGVPSLSTRGTADSDMSLHNNPVYTTPALTSALTRHSLPVSTPSQLADAFRAGWAARESVDHPSRDDTSLRAATLNLYWSRQCQSPPSS